MRRNALRGQQAFTLVEIMLVTALIGLLVALLLPSFIKDRQQSQGRRIVNDIRNLDAAINSWAMEIGASDGTPVDLAAVGQYTKLGVVNTVDIIGHQYVIGSVGDSQILVSPATKTALSAVNIDWGPY